ncbi:peptidoglycan editing factor PgeF [Alicyclobacillus cycloheptanicus]|uniref:Purine nucleoside phosphorylase n=1 Tax=Alicyclobacillus cycloheptanicus TaxID=1457 RepID=A0ABT9XMN4_9BACL|nr:peptidoglycan editing factor PgeF [Alicyclobacillus cycloheptanicus]MDQ0190983.1 YfiH family protein [Alicyclobacillus cycloheptanicus]WDM01489.1 peptidoglycan editing factor PgeF [Alicyclobacillus cycloheptanicus]
MLTKWTGSAGGPIWIRPAWPENEVRAAFSFRKGGVSEAPFASLNVGFHVGDKPECVIENRRRCAAAVGGQLEDMVVPEQVHGTGVAVVTRDDRGRGSVPDTPPIPDVDGVITNVPGLTLMVMAADCVPLLFYDRAHRAIGAAHSGWRGTVGHIAREMLTRMQMTYETQPQDVEVWLGPSIRQCCYEVDDRVADPVRAGFGTAPLLTRFGKPGKYLLSLQTCIQADLRQAGVPESQIHDTGVCTACHPEALFSHRAEHGKTGRLLGVIRLPSPS